MKGDFAIQAEHFHRTREHRGRELIRVGPQNAGGEDELAVGGGIRSAVDSRRAERLGFTALGVDEHELGGGVIIEEFFVVRRVEQVLEGADGSDFAGRLLHDRSLRHT